MNKQCQVCGFNGENVWRDGKYYCATCGSEIDVTQKDSNASVNTAAGVTINAVCPVCKNDQNITVQNGQCHCPLCGTTFDFRQAAMSNEPAYNTFGGYDSTRKAELEKQKNKNLKWGIVWLILFWPVSIYFFYKMYQISQEISHM